MLGRRLQHRPPPYDIWTSRISNLYPLGVLISGGLTGSCIGPPLNWAFESLGVLMNVEALAIGQNVRRVPGVSRIFGERASVQCTL